MIDPLDLLEAVARRVTAATGIRAVAHRAPLAWRDRSDPGPYAVVTQVSPWSPTLRGDGTTIRDRTVVQVSLWQTAAEAAAGTDAGRIASIVAALESTALDLGVVGHAVEAFLVPEPDSDDVHHVVEVAYLAAR